MKKRILIILLFLFGLINITCIYAYEEGKSMLKGKPFFSIHYDTVGCAYEIRVNDVPVDSDQQGGPMTTTLPINQWMETGKNTITLYLKPESGAKKLEKIGQNCQITAQLLIGQNDQPKNKDVPITTIKYNSSPVRLSNQEAAILGSSNAGIFDSSKEFKEDKDDGDIKISPVTIKPIKTKDGEGVELQRTVEIAIPFPQWKWLTSDKIANNEETKKELIKQYQKIWDALNNQNIEQLKNQFHERTDEYAKAFYETQEEVSIFTELQKAEDNPKQELVGFLPRYTILKVFGEGKLAELTSWDGETGVIVYNDKNGVSHDSYNIIFRKEGDKWIITR